MPAPYKRTFQHPDLGQSTIVVVDKTDYDQDVEQLYDVINLHNQQRATEETINKIKQENRIPMIGRGTKTEFLFKKYNITTNTMGIIVRGYSKDLLKLHIERN